MTDTAILEIEIQQTDNNVSDIDERVSDLESIIKKQNILINKLYSNQDTLNKNMSVLSDLLVDVANKKVKIKRKGSEFVIKVRVK